MREPRDKPPKPRSALAIMFMVLFTVAVTTYWPSSKEEKLGTDTPPSQSEDNANQQITNQPPPSSEIPSNGKVINPYLLEQQSWKEKDVKAITIKWEGNKASLSKNDTQIILESLRWTDTTIAEVQASSATTATSSAQDVQLQIDVGAKEPIVLPYNVSVNAYAVDGKWYYANDQVLLLMNRVLEQDKKLALFDHLKQQATIEEQQDATDEADQIQAEQLQIDGLDFEGWQQKLTQETPLWKIPFYDNDSAQISEVINIADEIVMLPGQIVFMDDAHQTKNGIKIGMSKNEVQRILDVKALKLPSRWSYKVGDYYIFHIYFQQDKVAFIVLNSPLV
ncbi:hypothetical protein J2Z32_004272 [Paenibacillus turicensis]|uniref:DUF4340 domain-containing protein n=1 Tax=Paenibacillus turicensis TaxID=160487 RepID=A0ABS4FYE0_9BACL|nr:hypothetical protein [Paenibacillus turicensis]MBP1907595.1 hypothetical protein [Paenibacillus turicensis]